MSDKRGMSRFPKRLTVKFGPSLAMENRGFIIDVSGRGFGLATNAQHPVGSRLYLKFDLAPGKPCHAEALVAWSKPRNELNPMGTMGLTLVTADSAFFSFLLTAVATPRAEATDTIP